MAIRETKKLIGQVNRAKKYTNMKLDDLLGFGKVVPIEKLVEVVSSAIGRLSKAHFDKKDIDVEAYKISKLAEARAEEMKIIAHAVKENFQMTGGIEYGENKLIINSPKELMPETKNTELLFPSIENRIEARIEFQETKKQLNIENITAFAAEELVSEESVTDEPLNEDWTARFFRIVEEISNEEMQALWGKILAGEIKQPKSYSLRTLELLRNLSHDEAKTFIRVANLAAMCGNSYLIFKGKNNNYIEKYGITYGDISLLAEVGLIQSGTFTSYQIHKDPIDSQHIIVIGNYLIIVNVKAQNPMINIPVYVFSSSGKEILKLVKSISPFDYISNFAESIKNENVEVKYATIIKWEGEIIHHTQPLLDL